MCNSSLADFAQCPACDYQRLNIEPQSSLIVSGGAPPPSTHSRLGRSLARWVREAREAGLDDESIESLLRVTLRAPELMDTDSEEIA